MSIFDKDFAMYRFLQNKGDKNEQQDSCDVFEKDGKILMVLADGLGGHNGGKIASKTLLEEAQKEFHEDDAPKEMFEKIVKNTKEKLKHLTQNDKTLNPKTTCVMSLIEDKNIHFAHIGDSRAYLFENKELMYRSKDHSVVQMLVGMGDITEEQMSSHPDKSKLLKSIGEDENADITYKNIICKDGFTILLCSDGLWENLSEHEIKECLFDFSFHESLEQMIKKIKSKNKKSLDNISAVMYKKHSKEHHEKEK